MINKSLSLFTLLFSLSVSSIGAYEIKFLLEVDQMLSLRGGVELLSEKSLGIKTAIGTSPGNILTYSSMFLIYYRFQPENNNWSFDLEFGLPIVYANFWENKYVDWDENISSPFAGWITGLSTIIRYNPWKLGLRLGAGMWWEWQEYNGLKGPRLMPIVAFSCSF